MILKLVTAPTTEPIDLAEAKAHLRVDTDAEDALIEALITEARQYCEEGSRRAFITQTLRLTLDAWPEDELRLPRPPLQSVTSITYTDSANVTRTLSSATYLVDTDAEPGRVALAYGCAWPAETLRPIAGIQITYVAGYGGAHLTPRWAKQAMLMLLAYRYEQRESVVVGQGYLAIPAPLATDSLLIMNR